MFVYINIKGIIMKRLLTLLVLITVLVNSNPAIVAGVIALERGITYRDVGNALVLSTATAVAVDRGISEYTRTAVPVYKLDIESKVDDTMTHFRTIGRTKIEGDDYRNCVHNVIRDFGAVAETIWMWTDKNNMAIHACKHAWDDKPNTLYEYDKAVIVSYLKDARDAFQLKRKNSTHVLVKTRRTPYRIITYYKKY
jgi:hypothetical protein